MSIICVTFILLQFAINLQFKCSPHRNYFQIYDENSFLHFSSSIYLFVINFFLYLFVCCFTDENECKYRPCDVFAHCTNTLGSFTCTCFPGYLGDGLHCEGKIKSIHCFNQ